MDYGLTNKVAIVTGAGSQIGFGKNIAMTLAKEGCHTVIADLIEEDAQKTANEIIALGRKAIAIQTDITDTNSVNTMAAKALAEFGQVDILINNAGAISPMKPFSEKTEEEWDMDINLNLKGAMRCCKALVDHMMSRKTGKIVNISTIGARKGKPKTSSYGAAKAGIIGFTLGLAVELGPYGINVNSVAPGLGLTQFGGGAPPEEKLKQAKETIPSRRFTTPEDIANMVVFFCSECSNNIIGQVIGVDGGESII